LAACRGCGTIFRGPGVAAATAVAGLTGAAALGPAAGPATGRCCALACVGGGCTTAGRATIGGAVFAAASACFRSRIAFNASPGLETFDRSNFGRSCCCLDALPARLPPLRYARTFSASSASIELECVFFSVTPTAVRASRIDLLFTSSSRARSLIRTLLIRSFFRSPNALAAHIGLFEIRNFGCN
jgi:hypothetical protein